MQVNGEVGVGVSESSSEKSSVSVERGWLNSEQGRSHFSRALVLLQLQRRLALRPDQRQEEALSRWPSRPLCKPPSNDALPRGFRSGHHRLNDRRAWPGQPCLRVRGRGWSAGKQSVGLWPEQPNQGWGKRAVVQGWAPCLGMALCGIFTVESSWNIFLRRNHSGCFGSNLMSSSPKWSETTSTSDH